MLKPNRNRSPLEFFRQERGLSRAELARLVVPSLDAPARAELATDIIGSECGLAVAGCRMSCLWAFLRRAGYVNLESRQRQWFNDQKPAVKLAAS